MTLIFSAYWSPLTRKSIDGDEARQRLASGAPLPLLVLGLCRSVMSTRTSPRYRKERQILSGRRSVRG